MDDTFAQEQEHLTLTYGQLLALRDALTEEIEVKHAIARQDLLDLSSEVRIDFGGADETIETLAAIETLNAVIDAYNQHHDLSVDKLRRTLLLLRQPYFAKVRLRMRPGRPPRDVYIGAAGVTDDKGLPLIVDWRSPVAETYYSQEFGPTSYVVDGRERTVELLLRRQYDIVGPTLRSYFDSTVAIEDSLLLRALRRHHSEKLQAITATIQREQNEVVRHEDVPALLVWGTAGSGKTSVMLQRVAYLLYRQRETLNASDVHLFTPNEVFGRYIDTVLPTMGEANPQVHTWKGFLADLGLSERADGAEIGIDELERLEAAVAGLKVEADDVRDITVDDVHVVSARVVAGVVDKHANIPMGRRWCALVKDALHDKISRRLAQMAHDDEVQEEMLSLDVDRQVEIFGQTISPDTEAETVECAKEYLEHKLGSAHDQVEAANWLRIDRIGMRLLGKPALTAAEWLVCKLAIVGGGAERARYVMVDEVQDYTPAQLAVLARYYPYAHFLCLGDPNQSIREGTASMDEVRTILERSRGSVDECHLLTSYRSSPEITALFSGFVDQGEGVHLNSVREEGVAPVIRELSENADAYLEDLRGAIADAADAEGLVAIVPRDGARCSWLERKLGSLVTRVHTDDSLPAKGVVLMPLKLAKGLEFDQVIVPDTQEAVYPDTPLSRRCLYTAVSRAMHRVTLLSQGAMTGIVGR